MSSAATRCSTIRTTPYSYEAEGDMYFDQERDRLIGDRHLVLFGDGSAQWWSRPAPNRCVSCSSRDSRSAEAIAWRDPIVMNAQEELRVAFDELDRGTFIKHRSASAPGEDAEVMPLPPA